MVPGVFARFVRRRTAWASLLPALLLVLCLYRPDARAAEPSGAELRGAEDVAKNFSARRWKELEAAFAPELRERMTRENLESTRDALESRGGRLLYVLAARPVALPGDKARRAIVPLDFERGAVDLWIDWSGEMGPGAVTDLQVKARTRAEAAKAGDNPLRAMFFDAPYVRHANFTEIEVEIPTAGAALPGILAVPKERPAPGAPAVLLIGDREMPDADGTLGPNRMLQDLAHGLASSGIASLRHDRRTLVEPDAFLSVYTIDDEVINDAAAAGRFLATRPEISRRQVILLGHGLGATCLPEIMKREPGFRALIMLSPDVVYTAGRQLREWRLRADAGAPVPGHDLELAERVLSSVEPGGFLDDQAFLDAPVGYWRSLDRIRPVPLMADYRGDALIIFGGRDFIRRPEDQAVWSTVLRPGSRIWMDNRRDLNHWLMPARDGGSPREIQQPGHVSEVVIKRIVASIQEWGRQDSAKETGGARREGE